MAIKVQLNLLGGNWREQASDLKERIEHTSTVGEDAAVSVILAESRTDSLLHVTVLTNPALEWLPSDWSAEPARAGGEYRRAFRDQSVDEVVASIRGLLSRLRVER